MSIFKKGLLSLGLLCAMSSAFGAGAALATPSYCDTVSGNLIQNCGFETGDLTSWGQTPAGSGSFYGVTGNPVHTGAYSVYFGAIDSQFDEIFQGFATTPGHTYVIDFAFNSDGSRPNAAYAGWFDGSYHYLGGATNLPVYDWVAAEYFYTATTSGAAIVFSAYNNPGFFEFDDVVVRDISTTTPEPLTLSLFGAGIACIGAAGRRKAS